jgi:hypothetical protein
MTGMGLMRRKMACIVLKREGSGLFQPQKPGSGANLCRHLASILLIGQDHSLDHTGRERRLLHTHVLS